MRARRPSLLLLGMMPFIGCNKAQSESEPPRATPHGMTGAEPQPQAPAPQPAPKDEPEPDPITHPCVVIGVKYDQILARGSDACSADADCGCYSGGISPKSGCGGVLAQATVAELAPLVSEFRDAKCRHLVNCAPWACLPRCDRGRCVR
ncbi:MAG: hypothetical protein KF718_01765 [Polyangiaceae bacterium]|nr:hypothetical protein [Polyangiaceae bacterium]